MLGGYQILDLRGIDLTISQSASDITNANVLNQLLKLRDYIDKAYNFSKPLENQLKPVLIRFRDKKANEKIEGATFGELSVVDNYYSFKITARLSGVLVLTINVTFEEVENGYGNYEWIIDDATIQLADETQTISGDLEVTGDLSVGDDATITGDASVGGDLEVTGNVSGAKFIGDVAMESIKDASGHNRFIEGNLSLVTIDGVNFTYAKWSLSGSHLLIVLAGTIADTKKFEGYSNIASISSSMPQWIKDKIYPTFSSVVDAKNIKIWGSDWSSEANDFRCGLSKSLDGTVLSLFNLGGDYTVTADRSFRIAFDLLIDNE